MQNSTQSENTRQKKMRQETDIVSLILEDHKALKKLIKVMKDSDRSQDERFAAFQEFMPALIAHAKPEEQTLYTVMKQDDELREDAFEGDVEHILADQLVEEIQRTEDADLRSAQIKVLAELVEHHIEEEEEDLLPEFKKASDEEIRSKMGNEFLQLKIRYLAAGDDNIVPDPKTEKEQTLQ